MNWVADRSLQHALPLWSAAVECRQTGAPADPPFFLPGVEVKYPCVEIFYSLTTGLFLL